MTNMIKIGKFTLETLTTGMYKNEFDFIREYIQNSADAIDAAIENKTVSPDAAEINISIKNNDLTIVDNGTGISINDAIQVLMDIGNSKKHGTQARGFRGIGRLSGLAFCDKLLFETSYFGEDQKTTISFDALNIKKHLIASSSSGEDLIDVIEQSTETLTSVAEKKEHYFKVTLKNIGNYINISSIDLFESYLKQVSPLPFSSKFHWGDYIVKNIRILGFDLAAYNIKLNYNDTEIKLFKEYVDEFISDKFKKANDKINNIFFDIITDVNGNPLCYMWYAETSFNGTIQKESIRGMRLRKGNILIGGKSTLNKIFKEERFNGWHIGEIHAISPNLIPNARRDDFERNDTYFCLLEKLQEWASKQTTKIRRLSCTRNLLPSEQKTVNNVIDDNQIVSRNEIISQYIKNSTVTESTIFSDENDEVAHFELLRAINEILDHGAGLTKYKSLNIHRSLTIEQKKVLERVFDSIIKSTKKNDFDELSEIIISEF